MQKSVPLSSQFLDPKLIHIGDNINSYGGAGERAMSNEVISFSCSLHYVMILVRFLFGSPIPMLSNGGCQLC